MLTTAVVGGTADGARVLVGAAASLGTSGTVVVPVASFVAVATLRRLASALQSTHLRLGDAAGMAGAPLDQVHSWDVDPIPAKKSDLGS